MALSRQILRAPRLVAQCQRLAITSQQKCNASAAAGDQLTLTFSTPAEVYYREVVVKQVDVPTQAGSFGIMPLHVPTIGTLKPGVLNVFEADGSSKKFFVGGGAVTVNKDSTVQILAEEAQPLERFDKQVVQNSLSQAQQSVNQATNEKDKAEAMIAVECLEALAMAV